MCVDHDSRPPILPIAGGSADSRDFRLTSTDGTLELENLFAVEKGPAA